MENANIIEEGIFGKDSVPQDNVATAPRKRRTKAEMEELRKAEREALRSEIIEELRAKGLLSETRPVENQPSEEAVSEMTFEGIILSIQNGLQVAKNHYNVGEGGQIYAYRSIDDILKVAKPLAASYGCRIDLESEIDYRSDAFCYIIGRASIIRVETGERLTKTGFARETPELKDRRSYAQGTGACRTYALKYALSNLLCLSDDDDPDAEQTTGGNQTKAAEASADNAPKPELKAGSGPGWFNALKWSNTNRAASNEDFRAYLQTMFTVSDETFAKLLSATGRDS